MSIAERLAMPKSPIGRLTGPAAGKNSASTASGRSERRLTRTSGRSARSAAITGALCAAWP